MSKKRVAESKITIRKSKKGYGSTWIYVPSELSKDSSFPFSKDERIMIEMTDQGLLIRKKQLFADIISTYGMGNATLPRLIQKKAEENKSNPFLYYNDQILSYIDIDLRSNIIANGLIELVKKLDLEKNHIALLLPNCPEYIISWFGITKAGCVFIPVNQYLRGDPLQFILKNSDTEIFILDYQYFDAFEEIRESLISIKTVILRNAPEDFEYNSFYHDFKELTQSPDDPPNLDIRYNDIMEIIYTEGTTGTPKGVIYRHQKILAGLIISQESKKFEIFKKIYCPIPLFHYFAQLVIITQALFLNASVVITDEFNPSTFWEEVRKYETPIIAYHGGIIPALINQPPKANDREHPVKWALGGEAPNELWEVFENRFGLRLYEGWASTEAIGFIFNPLGTKGGKTGSIGKPITSFEGKIVNENGKELPPGPDNIGEMAIKTDLTLRLEYYKKPQSTHMIKGNDGYFYTGDLGYMDNDGFIYYVGRKIDMVKHENKIIPIHIVEKLAKSHPLILDCAVINVADSEDTQEIKICAVPKNKSQITHKQFHEYLMENLAFFMVPRFIEYKDNIRNKTGRIRKFRLRDEWKNKISQELTWDANIQDFYSL